MAIFVRLRIDCTELGGAACIQSKLQFKPRPSQFERTKGNSPKMSSYGSGLGGYRVGGYASDASSCVRFDYEALRKATGGFERKKKGVYGKLGEGGFGPVFLGSLCNTQVAIKVLRRVVAVSNLEEFHCWILTSGVVTGRQRS